MCYCFFFLCLLVRGEDGIRCVDWGVEFRRLLFCCGGGGVGMATQVTARVWLRLSGKAVLLGAVAAVCGVAGASILPSRALVEVADLGNPVISPDGRKVADRKSVV